MPNRFSTHFSKTSPLIFLALTLCGLVQNSYGEDTASADAAYWKSVYEDNHVVTIDISLTGEAWKAMQPVESEHDGRRPRDGGPVPGGGMNSESDFTYVKARMTIDGETFNDAGLRFKGNSSYRFSSDGYRRPFKIDTNRFVKGQKLHGCTKVNLSNAFLDPAYMKEKLAYEVYRAAGVPSPEVGWATVTLTIEGVVEKQALGVYALVEQVDKNFLVRNFGKENKGSLLMKPEVSSNWEYPGDDSELYERFEIKVGEDNTEQIRRFSELLKLIHEGSDEDFAKEIGERMDLDQFAGYLAATSVLSNMDSYIGMPHNYYLLMNKADGKLHLLPWDVNEAFGTFTMGGAPEELVDWDIDRPWVAELKLVERLFATESFTKLYKSAIAALMKEAFTEEKLFARMAEFEKVLTPHLTEQAAADLRIGLTGDADGYNTAIERRVLAIKPFVSRRIESVNAQLAGNHEGTQIEARRRGPRPPGGGPGGRRPDQPEGRRPPRPR
ncbi:MAG: CotH kinase family protein [Verrucomicrobiales bacterium]